MIKKSKSFYIDKMYLFIALAVTILLITYRFIYFNNTVKAKSIGNELKNLRLKEAELHIKNEKVKTIKEENKSLQGNINEIIESYSYGVSVESIVLFLKSLEEESGMSINTITLSDPEYVAGSLSDDSDNQTAESGALTTPAVGDGTSLKASDNTAPAAAFNSTDQNTTKGIGEGSTINCYKTVINIDFKVSYEGLKRGIDYINSSSGKKDIEEISLVYDMETGNLGGTMAINMYYLTGTGRKQEEPVIGSVKIGTPNIFGTIELPEDNIEKAPASK